MFSRRKKEYSSDWVFEANVTNSTSDSIEEEGGKEILKRISFSFYSLPKEKMLHIGMIISLVLGIFSFLVGVCYTESEKPILLSFGDLSNLRYIKSMEDENEKLKSMFHEYENLKKENPYIIQQQTNDAYAYLKSLQVSHERMETIFKDTHKLAKQNILSMIDLFTLLASYSSTHDQQVLKALKQKEANLIVTIKKTDDQLKVLKEGIYRQTPKEKK